MRRWLVVFVLGLLCALASCGDDSDSTAVTTAGPTTEPVESVDLSVFAAASLTDAFGELGAAFESTTPGVTVTFNFAGSSALREQLLGGAPADVFASANTANMDQVVEGGLVDGEPAPFVTNQLQIAVPAGNEAGVAGLADFADADLLIGLCAEDVPCGQFGREALASAGVTPSIDTDEPDVRSLLTKIEAGELDAGIVYRTDVRDAGDAVEGIDIPPEDNVTATYPIAALAGAEDLETARAFVAFVLSGTGQAILESHGFDPA